MASCHALHGAYNSTLHPFCIRNIVSPTFFLALFYTAIEF
uniref:Uncharacterized protein n=1 Tax=Anguilla anguilla TaxID=7936 RepID=A0A0E9SFJ3_ANGAN